MKRVFDQFPKYRLEAKREIFTRFNAENGPQK